MSCTYYAIIKISSSRFNGCFAYEVDSYSDLCDIAAERRNSTNGGFCIRDDATIITYSQEQLERDAQ